MPNKTAIGWTDRTSNPIYAVDKVTGKRGWFCTKVSEGCGNCYAETLNMRFGNKLMFTVLNSERVQWRLSERELDAIRRLRKPQRIFMCDMMDLFHPDVPAGFIDRVFGTMLAAKRNGHTFQVLTKRPGRMRRWIAQWREYSCGRGSFEEQYSHVWLGVSAENQKAADERIPILLDTPAVTRFVSCEPLLGPLDLSQYLPQASPHPGGIRCSPLCGLGLSWVIVGGESGGPPERALVERNTDAAGVDANQASAHLPVLWEPKPEALEWVRSIRDQCQMAGMPFFFKQWGGPTPKAGGRTLAGLTWDEFPEREAVPA